MKDREKSSPSLTLAYHRDGQDGRALEIVGELAGREPWPSDLGVRAMAGHRLGRDDESRQALEQLRAQVRSGRWLLNQYAAGFLAETERFLASRPRAR